MTMKRVEWILVIYYGITAHRAIYGRLTGEAKYSKDYIQLSRRDAFLNDLELAFPTLAKVAPSAAITYKWPGGSAAGTIFRESSDRPHLAWETSNAPLPWKMHPKASASRIETILGDPTFKDATSADAEFKKLSSSGFGQPFLVATKLQDEDGILHLRVQVGNPGKGFEYADIGKAPKIVGELAAETSSQSALAWRYLPPLGASGQLFFDPAEKAQPWTTNPPSIVPKVTAQLKAQSLLVGAETVDSDLLAEESDSSTDEVAAFEQQIDAESYRVPDETATTKTRGSAQRAFSKAVKGNYGMRCAVTGIQTREFLVASHIVPWSVDENIRLDPSNGICLSVLVDRAFEGGYLTIEDDLTITIDWEKVGSDESLRKQLQPFDGSKLAKPKSHQPKVEYLHRRRELH